MSRGLRVLRRRPGSRAFCRAAGWSRSSASPTQRRGTEAHVHITGTYFVLHVGEVFSTSTVMSHPRFPQTRFYKKFAHLNNVELQRSRGPPLPPGPRGGARAGAPAPLAKATFSTTAPARPARCEPPRDR